MSNIFQLTRTAELSHSIGRFHELTEPVAPEPATLVRQANHKHRRLNQMAEQETLRLVHRLFTRFNGESPRCVVFAAMRHAEGCTDVCVRTAKALASSVESSVCLVDANLYTPRLADIFSVDQDPGLTDAISCGKPTKECVRQVLRSNLYVMPRGSGVAGLPGCFTSNRMRALVSELRQSFGYVIIDGPPLAIHASAMALGQSSDGLVMVLKANSSRRSGAVKMAETLRSSNVQLFGAVLNYRTLPIPEKLYRRL